MASHKTRRGKVTQTSETAEVFSNRVSFNKAFTPLQKTAEPEPDSESDSMIHPYSERNSK